MSGSTLILFQYLVLIAIRTKKMIAHKNIQVSKEDAPDQPHLLPCDMQENYDMQKIMKLSERMLNNT